MDRRAVHEATHAGRFFAERRAWRRHKRLQLSAAGTQKPDSAETGEGTSKVEVICFEEVDGCFRVRACEFDSRFTLFFLGQGRGF